MAERMYIWLADCSRQKKVICKVEDCYIQLRHPRIQIFRYRIAASLNRAQSETKVFICPPRQVSKRVQSAKV